MIDRRQLLGAGVAGGLLAVGEGATAKDPRQRVRLKVSENRRFLVKADGSPFFYLGDTAWELFHRLKREEVEVYLRKRLEQRFTVIQAVALAELDGLAVPNAYGHLPLIENDPARPAVRDGAEDYWDHVDYVVEYATNLGLVIGFLPAWGRYWNGLGNDGPAGFTPENAYTYGLWLGKRYREQNIIWILGGDRAVENDTHRAILRAMAKGLREGDGGEHLITFHPRGGGGSAESFHDEPWLDFNMRQNGHAVEYTGRYDLTFVDYQRTPVKPVMDGEPVYEDHPVSFNAKNLGHTVAADVRRALYWDLFSGAFGHTYGHHSIWQFWTPERAPVNNPLLTWIEALDQPGGQQMQYARDLLESRPFLSRIPDDSIIVTDRVPTAVPGAGRYRFAATRDSAGTYLMVYVPAGRRFTVQPKSLRCPVAVGWWFNPRNGKATRTGEFDTKVMQSFMPPEPGEVSDWVLVLDDPTARYPRPGASTD